MKNQSNILFLSIIIVAAIFAGLFVYPGGFGSKWRPWKLGLDLVGGSYLIYNIDTSQVKDADKDSVLGGLRYVIEKRINNFGVSEPQVSIANSAKGPQLIVGLAGVKNVSQAIDEIGATPLLDFREVRGEGTSTVYIKTDLTGRYIDGAQLDFDSVTRAPEILLNFSSEGAKLFEDITGRNVGKPLAIFLDDQLIEAPVVQQKIAGGKARITGKFTRDEAKQIVERFNAGALPAPISLINQQTISPSLGVSSLRKNIVAGGVGTLLVMIFMITYYGVLGIFASLALAIYIAITLGIFKLVPVTMTLAGIAGFILTIGMAVDANILIFERIKEELKKGISKEVALREGFKRAWPSIRDSNTSTIITATILWFFTSSFVRGFALTLLIGVLISMFSAITTTRLFLKIFLGRNDKFKK